MRILITAGGTREYIDPVRFVSNASSGKMGYALARVAAVRGHLVTLITAPTSLRPPPRVQVANVVSAADMFQAVRQRFDDCDCLIMAAAVADYTPVGASGTKIKKSGDRLTVELKPTRDILKWAGRNKQGRIVVGFALEDQSLRERAEQKLREKNLDVIVANSPAAIGADSSTVHIKTADGSWMILVDTLKRRTANRILEQIETVALAKSHLP